MAWSSAEPIVPRQPLPRRVKELVAQAGGSDPIPVPFVEETGCKREQCFENVKLMIARTGGDLVAGWCLWDWPGLYARAEHHAVWRTDAGLIDVTPKVNGEREILFVIEEAPIRRPTQRTIRRSLYQRDDWDNATRELVKLMKQSETLNERAVAAPDRATTERYIRKRKVLNAQIEVLEMSIFSDYTKRGPFGYSEV